MLENSYVNWLQAVYAGVWETNPPEESFTVRHDMSLVTLQQIRESGKTLVTQLHAHS